MRTMWVVAATIVSLATGSAAAVDGAATRRTGPDAEIHERTVILKGAPPDSPDLRVIVLTPVGAGPFPVAVMNHGAGGRPQSQDMTDVQATFATYYFLSRGYAVILPLMRGYGGSRGLQVTLLCRIDQLATANAIDIRAVLDQLKADPLLDTERVVMAGQSAGGWNALAYGMLGDARVKGIVSFFGGVRMSTCAPKQQDPALVKVAGEFGERTRVPSLWFFGDNDAIFPKSTWEAMHQSYRSHGGEAELVAFGPFREDAHKLLSQQASVPIIAPRLDAFLTRIGLPGRVVEPLYLPRPTPPPSRYADAADASAVPYLNDAGRGVYAQALAKKPPRAVVVSPGGSIFYASNGFDPLTIALDDCRRQRPICEPYLVDHDVVWVRPTPAPPPTRFAPLEDVAAVPFIDDNGRDGFRKFLAFSRPRAFAIAPDGAWSAAAGADPLAAVLSSCSRQHAGCRLYAVDRDVVWPEN